MRHFTKYLFLFLLAMSAPQAWAKSNAATRHEITGFLKVTENIYRGGRPKNDEQMRLLKSRGFRTIINLQGEAFPIFPGETEKSIKMSEESATRAGLRYLNLPFSTAQRLSKEEEATLIEVARAMNDPQMQPVYVHCNVGADRTGVAVAAFRILYQGCSFEQAKAEIIDTGLIWTPIFTAPQMPTLRMLAREQRKISGAIRQPCPLPAIEE